jgi:hypothetical protein
VTSCGRRGEECIDCGTGFACVNGICVVDSGVCSAASCPSGCCSGTACVQSDEQDWSACGTGGDACSQCTYGVRCSGGACTAELDPDSSFFVRIVSVTVTERNAGQDNWDVLGGLPDPFVCAGPDGNSGCTSSCGDTTTCALDASEGLIRDSSGGPILFSGADLTAGLPIGVYDDDVDASDLIGAGSMAIHDLEESYTTGPFSQVVDLTFVVY